MSIAGRCACASITAYPKNFPHPGDRRQTSPHHIRWQLMYYSQSYKSLLSISASCEWRSHGVVDLICPTTTIEHLDITQKKAKRGYTAVKSVSPKTNLIRALVEKLSLRQHAKSKCDYLLHLNLPAPSATPGYKITTITVNYRKCESLRKFQTWVG